MIGRAFASKRLVKAFILLGLEMTSLRSIVLKILNELKFLKFTMYEAIWINNPWMAL
jgi:hypothetical protein